MTKIISVIIASLRLDEDLSKTIYSCQNQTGVKLELIICIKSLADSSPRIETNTQSTFPITLIYYNDTGIADAWNLCLQHARGDYFNFLGAGDTISMRPLSSISFSPINPGLSESIISNLWEATY